MLSDEAIKEFQALYKSEFGIELTLEKAAETGEHLLRFYKIVHKKHNL